MIEIKDLRKEYPGFTLQCSLAVPAGTITGLIGQNGAGKSTLFKSLLRLIRINSGKVTILGKDLSEISENDMRMIGSVMAESGFSGYLTLRSIRRIMKSFYPAFREDWFTAQCRKFGLPDDRQIREFSTGMKAKLKVLCALSYGAKLLILDEPTSGLDVAAREDVLDLLRAYMKEDEERSILISSHISKDLETLCDDFYMIHEGQIILHEETDRLLSDYAMLKVTPEVYEKLDKQYILRTVRESYGYSCLTNQREYYQENYPEIVVEKIGIDEVVLHVIRGGKAQ